MSRLMRRGRRQIPSRLDIGKPSAANLEKGLSPRRLLSPRQFITIVPSQATPLPTPIQSILTTTVFQIATPSVLPTAPSISMSPAQTQVPTATDGGSIMPLPTTLESGQAAMGGGNASTTVVDVAEGSNVGVVAGVAGAAGFSFLSVALFFYVRKKNASNARDNEKRATLDMRRAQAIAGQLNRPYSSRERMG